MRYLIEWSMWEKKPQEMLIFTLIFHGGLGQVRKGGRVDVC